MSTLKTRLVSLLADTSLTVTESQVDLLIGYLELLIKWNKAYNLTSVRDSEEMVAKHLVDSLVVSPYLKGQHFIDVGTGPGLPGVPLAIVNPDKHFVLLDSLGKRIRFLNEVKRQLKLTNIEPVQARVEEWQPAQRLDGVMSRAFASLSDMINVTHHLLDDTGVFYALKGVYPEKEIAELPDSVTVSGFEQLSVPGLDGQRHLIYLNKHV